MGYSFSMLFGLIKSEYNTLVSRKRVNVPCTYSEGVFMDKHTKITKCVYLVMAKVSQLFNHFMLLEM